MYYYCSKPVFIFFIIVFATLASFSVNAQQLLEPVVVTATRTAETIDDTMASVSLISRDDIEASSAVDLTQLLSMVKGLDLRPSGAYGKKTSLFMRGTSSSHTLVLIDGVKIYSATGGATALQYLPLSQIDHIEIVRGPRSSLYGSEAIGGVIQIFTRKGSKKNRITVSAGAGSNNTDEFTTNISGSVDKFSYSLNFGHFKSDGIDARKHTSPNDDDGYKNQSVSSQLGYSFNSAFAMDVRFMNAQGTNYYDNCRNSSSVTSDDCSNDFKQQSLSSKFIITPNSLWDASVTLGSTTDESSNYWQSLPNNTFKTEHSSLSFLNNFQVQENHLIMLGIDYSDDTVAATPYPASADKSRDNTGVFVAWNFTYNKLDINTSVRQDDNEQFGKHATGNITTAYTFINKLRLSASYGSAFKAPSFNELYYPDFGKADLKPEESNSVEVALKRKEYWGRWDVGIYQTTIDNLIAYDSNTLLAGNISKAEITGIEAELASVISGWDILFTGTYLEPLNKDDAYKDKILQARAQQTLQLAAHRQFGKFNFNASLLSQGKRYSNPDNSKQVSGYTVLDLRMVYAITIKLQLDAKLNNVFDKEYVINESYNTLGRTVFLAVNYEL